MTDHKTTGIIGAGNMAYYLLERLSQTLRVNIWNRNPDHSNTILRDYPTVQVYDDINDFHTDSDIILLAVNDDSISSLLSGFPEDSSKIFIHHSGNYSINTSSRLENTGVLWPVYSIIKANVKKYNSEVPIVYNGSNAETLAIIRSLAAQLSAQSYLLDDERKKYAHLIAVMTNNFINHLIAACQSVADEKDIDFSIFHPIIEQTIQQMEGNTQLAFRQSGPARRNDTSTIQSHMSLLEGHPDLQKIYNSITQSIIHQYIKND